MYQPQPPTPQAPASKRPFFARPGGITLIGVGALLIGVGIGAAGASGGSKADAAAAAATNTVTATATVKAAPVTRTATVTGHPRVIRTVATKVRTRTVTYTPPPPKAFGDGTYVVGMDIKPGMYHADGGQGYCAWFRASDPSGSNLLDAGNTNGGPLTVVVRPSDGSLVIQGDCTFHKID